VCSVLAVEALLVSQTGLGDGLITVLVAGGSSLRPRAR
jgi:hypothetical protein